MNKRMLTAIVCCFALISVACGNSNDNSTGASGQAQGKPTLSIASPADGASVKQPFTIHLSTNATLGTPDSGNYHVHLYYDGDQTNYDKVYSDSFEVSSLSPGKHTIVASLRNADHSPAGPQTQVSITVTGGGSSSGSSGNSGDSSNGNGGYHY